MNERVTQIYKEMYAIGYVEMRAKNLVKKMTEPDPKLMLLPLLMVALGLFTVIYYDNIAEYAIKVITNVQSKLYPPNESNMIRYEQKAKELSR